MANVKETDDYWLDGTVIYGAKLGDPLAVIDKKTSFRCGVLYNDLDFATLDITFPADVSFIKLSQTTLQETYRSEVPETLAHITPGIGVREYPNDKREMLPNKVNRYLIMISIVMAIFGVCIMFWLCCGMVERRFGLVLGRFMWMLLIRQIT